MDLASENGHIDILDWFKNNGLQLKYTHNAIVQAAANGPVHILNWWKKQIRK